MFKLAVVGSRNFTNFKLVCDILDPIKKDISCIISGGAVGADFLGKRYANTYKIEYLEFLADWGRYGKSAGYRRNIDIISACDIVYAFWDGLSKGTKHSIDIAAKQSKKVVIISV